MDKLAKGFAYLYGGVVIAAAIPYGLVQTVAFTGICAIMFVLAFLAMLIFGKPKRGGHVFSGALIIFLILCAWILLQSYGSSPIALPEGSIWKDAYDLAGLADVRISLEPSDTLNALLYLALPAMTFLTGLIVADTDERSLIILRVLAIGGGLVSLFGLLQFLLAPHSLLAVEKDAYIDSLTAVFVNRNTAATYLGVVLLLLMTFAVQSGREYFGRSPSQGSEDGLRGIPLAVYCALTVVAFTSLMLTQSRGGIFAFGTASLVYFPMLAFHRTQRSSREFGERPGEGAARRWSRVIIAIVLILGIADLLASRAIFRASVNGLDDGRFCVWPDIVKAVGQHWLYGTGFGTFRTAFSAYRDPSCGIAGIFDRAHNSYLEGFLTLGIVFPLTLAAFLLLIGTSFWHGYGQRKRLRPIPFVGFAGTVLVAIHALVDFSLQIPGFAVLYAAFLAATISVCHGRDTRQVKKKHNPSKMTIQNASQL
ncbi:O-antigen ligase family protein [Hyphomicrobiales bacterium]|jgi:hypothetical protein